MHKCLYRASGNAKGRHLIRRTHFFSPVTPLRRLFWQRLRQTFRLMVGVHDYQRYLHHMRCHHPDRVPLSEKAFYRRCLDARYPSKAGQCGKCPC